MFLPYGEDFGVQKKNKKKIKQTSVPMILTLFSITFYFGLAQSVS